MTCHGVLMWIKEIIWILTFKYFEFECKTDATSMRLVEVEVEADWCETWKLVGVVADYQ